MARPALHRAPLLASMESSSSSTCQLSLCLREHPPRWRLSDFLIEEEIFRTHNGAVFKARFRSERKKQCVLKERKAPELGKDRDIANEVSLLERLDHPNIVKCYGHFRDDKKRSLYIVLEYAQHGDLHAVVERRRRAGRYFREKDVWRIFLQICAGLIAAW